MTFVVTTRMKLEGPTLADLAAVKREMQSGLRGVKASVRVGVDKSNVRQLAELRKELRLVRDGSKLAGQEVENFGRRVGIAGKRYLAFSVATVGVVKALGALRSGVSDAIDFEKAIIKIGQVSGRTIKQVDGLRSDILGVSASFGVSSSEIAEAAVTLAQTGRPLAQVRKDIEAIAKANLSPTFGNAKDTVEGLIAVQNQFEKSGLSTIEILSKLNTVAGKFPVESSDLITAVKKTGGAFQAAGGDLDELLALFTAVRSTTRESADTIGTAFRTITGRLGRIKTINFFKDIIDVDLVKDGKILAPLQAIEAIASKIKKLGIDSKSPLFSSIVEELGGIRQRAKVIPLLLQIDKAQKVLNTSRNSGNSITKDAEKAQEGLGTQITKVRQEFQKFVDNVLKDPAFRTFATELLNITKGLIGVADAARPLIPLVGLLGTALAFKAVIPLSRGFSPKIGGFSQGGTPGKTFSGSGIVPGTGITDSVPVMMKPQEFVMTTQAHRKYGTDTMKAINEGRLPGNFSDNLPKFGRGGRLSRDRIRRLAFAESDLSTLRKTAEPEIVRRIDATIQQMRQRLNQQHPVSKGRITAGAPDRVEEQRKLKIRNDANAELNRDSKGRRVNPPEKLRRTFDPSKIEQIRAGNLRRQPLGVGIENTPNSSGISLDDKTQAARARDARLIKEHNQGLQKTTRRSRPTDKSLGAAEIINQIRKSPTLPGSRQSARALGQSDSSLAEQRRRTDSVLAKVRKSTVQPGIRKSSARAGGTEEDQLEAGLFLGDRSDQKRSKRTTLETIRRGKVPRGGLRSRDRQSADRVGGTTEDQREADLFFGDRENGKNENILDRVRKSTPPSGNRKSTARTGGTGDDQRAVDLFIDERKKERSDRTAEILDQARKADAPTGIKSSSKRIGTDEDQKAADLFFDERDEREERKRNARGALAKKASKAGPATIVPIPEKAKFEPTRPPVKSQPPAKFALPEKRAREDEAKEKRDLARRQFPYKSKEELGSTRSTIRAAGIASVLNKPLTKEEKGKVKGSRLNRAKSIREEQERDKERRRQGLKSAGFGDNSDLGSISRPPSAVSIIRGRSKEPSRFSKIRNKLTLSGSSRGGGVGGVGGGGGGGLNKSALFGIGGVGAAAALSGGLLESEEGQKLAKTLGGVAVGFGVLNEALKQSKPLLETRQKLEKAQNKSNAAKGFLEVAGSEERAEKRKLKDLEVAATKNKDLSTGLSTTKAAAEDRVRKAETDEKKAGESLKNLPKKASAKNVAIAEQELRVKKEITKEAKKAVTENQKLLTTSNKRNAELTEEIALQQKATEKATGRREGGAKGVTRMNEKLLVAEDDNRKQERRNKAALFASVIGTAAGTFFSDSGTEKLEKGDRSGIGSAVLGGTLQLGGTGVGIGALLGKGGGIAGGLIGAFAGFAVAASKAEQALNNFRAETIKAFGSLGTLEFNKAGDEDNAKTEKSREAITDITKALRGEAGSLTQKKNRVGIVGRFGAGIDNFLQRTVDSTFGDGGIRSTTRKSTKAALLADRNTIPGTSFLDGFNQFKVAEQIELRRNIRNQEKAIESKTQGGEGLDILLRQAETTKLTAVEFSQEFNGIITETAKLLNPRIFTEGSDADQKVTVDFLKEKLEERLRQAKKTRADTLSATQNISNVIFSSLDNLNNSLATINERLSNTAVARANLDFIGSGSIGQSRGLGSDIANVVDINRSEARLSDSQRQTRQIFRLDPRSRLNERAEAIGGSFGAEGQLISERFVNRSNAVEAIKELDRLIGGSTETIDANRFNDFKTQSVDQIKDPNTKRFINLALEDIFGDLDEVIDPRKHPIGTTLDAINKKFAPLDTAMGRLAEIFNDQTNFLRSGLAQQRAISSKTIQEELKKNNISQQSSDLLTGLLGKEKKILAEQKNREILTKGLSAAELGKKQRKAKGGILELIAERETGRDKKGKVIDADRVAKIEIILDREITARDRATEGLRYLTDVARSSAVAILAFQKAETDRLAKKSILERKLTGTPQEVRAINRKEALLGGFNQNPAVVQNITTRTFAEILSFAKEFGDAIVPQTGKSGKDTVDELLLARVKGRNLGFGTDLRPGEINRRDSLKGLANERTVLNPVTSRQEDSNALIRGAIEERENIFITGLDRVTREIITGATNEAGLEAGIGTARTEALNAQTEILKTLKIDFNEFGKSLADGFNSVFDFNFVPKKTPPAPAPAAAVMGLSNSESVSRIKAGTPATNVNPPDLSGLADRLEPKANLTDILKKPKKLTQDEIEINRQLLRGFHTGGVAVTKGGKIGTGRSSKDNRLGITSKGPIKVGDGEAILNLDQQAKLSSLTGMGVSTLFSLIGLPGFAGGGVPSKKELEALSNDQFFEEMFGDKANPGSPLALLQLDSRLSKQKINRPSGPLGPNGQRPSVPDSPTGTVRPGGLSHRGTQSLSRSKKKTPTGGLSLAMTGELQNRIPVNTDPRPGSIPRTGFGALDDYGYPTSDKSKLGASPLRRIRGLDENYREETKIGSGPDRSRQDGASPSGLNKSGRDPSSFAVPEANTPSLSDARHQQLENLGERSPDFQKKLDSAPGWVEELHDIRDDLGKVAADQQFKHISPSGRVKTQREISAGNTESLNNRGPVRTTPKDIDQIIEEGRVSRMVDPLAKGPTQLPKAPESIGNVVSQKSGPKIKASDEIERLRKEKAASPEKVSPVKTAIDNFVKALKPDPLKDFNKSLKDSGETQKKLNGLKNKQYDQKYDDLTVGIQEANDKGDTKKAAALSKKRQTMVQQKDAQQSREADKKFAQGMTEAMPQLGSGDGRLKALTQDAAGTNMLKTIVKNEREMADSNTKARQGRIGPAEINEEEKDSLLKKNADERADLEGMKKNSSDVHQRNEKARLDREEKAIRANKAPLSMIQERAKARVKAERGHTDGSFPVTNMAPHNRRGPAPAGWGGQRSGVSGVVNHRRGVSGVVNHRRGVVDELAGGIPEGHDRLMANRAARKEEEDRLWANRGRRSSKDTKPAARKMAPLSTAKEGESIQERRDRQRKDRESFFGVGPAIGGPPRTETPEQRKARLNKSRSDFFGTGPAITPDPDETPEMAEKRRAKSKAGFYGVGPATQGKKIITGQERDAAKSRVEKALFDSGVSAEEAREPDIANVINENNSSTFIADRKILESSETEEERKKRRRSAKEDFYGAGPAIEGPGGLPSSKNNPGRLKKIQAAREAREKKLQLRSMPAGTRRAEKEKRIEQAREMRRVQEQERADNIERIKQGEIERGSLTDMSMRPDEQPGQVTQAAQPQTQFNGNDPFRGVWGAPGSQGPQGALGVAGAPQAAQVTQAAQPQAQSSFPDTISFDGTMNLNVNVAGLGDLEGRFSDVARMVVNNALNEFADQNQMSRPQQLANNNAAPGSAGSEATS